MKVHIAGAMVSGVLVIALSACGGSTNAASSSLGNAATTTLATTTSAALAAGATTTTASSGSATVTKVSANDAGVDEIAAALQAAGVDNADRWAREVAEYRPYDTSDPNLTHLRDELAKYNPAPGVVDLIVSVLEP